MEKKVEVEIIHRGGVTTPLCLYTRKFERRGLEKHILDIIEVDIVNGVLCIKEKPMQRQ